MIKSFIICGLFPKKGKANLNGRIYSDGAYAKLIKNFGIIDKGENIPVIIIGDKFAGSDDFSTIAGKVIGYEDGEVAVEIYNTECGKILKVMRDAGVEFGIGAIIQGSLENINGVSTVQSKGLKVLGFQIGPISEFEGE
jgi:hypothetical protein